MASVLAVVVSYNPSSEIQKNFQSILKQVAHAIIVDNNSSSDSKMFVEALVSERVTPIFNDRNLGVGEGFNQGMKWGLERGFKYFLLLDQDSTPQDGMVEALLSASKQFAILGKPVLLGPVHQDYDRKIEKSFFEEVSSAPLLITSGSLVSKDLIDRVGFYDEKMFIDHVDHDYCLRVTKNGGLCLRVNSAVLLHRFGKAEIRKFMGRSFFLQDYSPMRRYHMMRNRIVLYKRYGVFRGDWFWLDLRSGLVDLVKLVFFEREKLPKIKAVIIGIRDGIYWHDS